MTTPPPLTHGRPPVCVYSLSIRNSLSIHTRSLSIQNQLGFLLTSKSLCGTRARSSLYMRCAFAIVLSCHTEIDTVRKVCFNIRIFNNPSEYENLPHTVAYRNCPQGNCRDNFPQRSNGVLVSAPEIIVIYPFACPRYGPIYESINQKAFVSRR